MLDARWALVQLNAWPGLDVGALFDDKGLVLGGAKSHLPDKSGSAELLAAGLLEPGHDVAAVGLHVVDHLLDGLLLVVAKLPVALNDAGLRQYGVLHLVADLCLQLEVHVRGLEFGE